MYKQTLQLHSCLPHNPLFFPSTKRFIGKDVLVEVEDFTVYGRLIYYQLNQNGKPRKEQFRQEAFLPLEGERAALTQLVRDYLQLLKPQERLFNFGRTRALQITHSILGIPNHWLRAYGEDYLYENWDHDILAVADYVKVDPRTLQEYIRKRYEKYPAA